MGLFIRLVPTTGAIAVTADGATYNECGDTEIALFVGKTGPTARIRGVTIQNKLRKIAHQVARKPGAIPGVRASGTITVGVEVENDKCTVDGTDFVLKAANPTGDQVLIGATKAATALNLVDRINRNATTKAKVWASIDSVTPEQVNLTAVKGGTTPNGYTLAETGTSFTVSGANLAGGTIRRKAARVVPGTTGYTYADVQTGDAVTESNIALVWGQTAWETVQQSGKFIRSVEKLLSYWKRTYGRVA
jgi:hypothetical protein